jgi:hypothetical protein
MHVLICRLVSVARGEQEYFDESGIPTATEACKSNALMRCCKDLGIASELWDPSFIREFKAKHLVEVWVEHAKQKTKLVIHASFRGSITDRPGASCGERKMLRSLTTHTRKSDSLRNAIRKYQYRY